MPKHKRTKAKRARTNEKLDKTEDEEDTTTNTTATSTSDDNNIIEPPIRDGRSVDFPVSNLHDHLVCKLCTGYFRDAHTLVDCLHTYCKSCLILFFQQKGLRCCPTCNTKLSPDPFFMGELMPDRTLQSIVDKTFPFMKTKDDEDAKLFYSTRGIDIKPEYAHEEQRGKKISVGSMRSKAIDSDKMIEIQLDADSNPPNKSQQLPELKCPLIYLSGQTKISTIKLYLIKKLGLTDTTHSNIQILCNDIPLGDESSLTFIVRTIWITPNKMLALKYRLEAEDSPRKKRKQNSSAIAQASAPTISERAYGWKD